METEAKKRVNELAVTRRELKYPVNISQYIHLSGILKGVMKEDKHNGMNGYAVRSLYFDSYANTDFYQKLDGDENRKKIRLRIYTHDAELVKLEIKRKYGDYQLKKSLSMHREDARELISCNYDVLLKYDSETARMIYHIMKVNHVRPVVLIEYNRKAFIHPMNEIRLTLDSDIRSSESDFRFFEKDPLLAPVEEDYFALLEVKYNGFLFQWMNELLTQYTLNRESYSKYSSSRGLFEHTLA